MTATEATLRTALRNAMDGNLSISRRRSLLDDYRAAVLTNAGHTVLDDNARGFLRFALDTAVSRLTEDGAHPLSAEDMPAVVALRKLAGGA